MKLSDLIGVDVIDIFKNSNISDTLPIVDFDMASEFYFDNSFFDNHDRVKKKYLSIPDFQQFYKMSLEELATITNPSLYTRTAVLATTEFLLPYVAYTLKYIEKEAINLEMGKRHTLPFIIYAPSEWNLIDNIQTIDLMSSLYKNRQISHIRLIIPTDRAKLFTSNGKPRVTLQELYRLYKNLGDVDLAVKINGLKLIATFKQKIDGGRRRRRRFSRTRLLRGRK
jgi:hypothetical protein